LHFCAVCDWQTRARVSKLEPSLCTLLALSTILRFELEFLKAGEWEVMENAFLLNYLHEIPGDSGHKMRLATLCCGSYDGLQGAGKRDYCAVATQGVSKRHPCWPGRRWAPAACLWAWPVYLRLSQGARK